VDPDGSAHRACAAAFQLETGRLADFARRRRLNEADIANILGFNNALAHFAIECNSHARHAYKVQTGEDGISLPPTRWP